LHVSIVVWVAFVKEFFRKYALEVMVQGLTVILHTNQFLLNIYGEKAGFCKRNCTVLFAGYFYVQNLVGVPH
jgi:hypothetical protein